MQDGKPNYFLYISAVAALAGIVGGIIAIKNYIDNADVRKMQRELTQLQLEEAKLRAAEIKSS